MSEIGAKLTEMRVQFSRETWIYEHFTLDCDATESFSNDLSHNMENCLCIQILNDHGHSENTGGDKKREKKHKNGNRKEEET